MNGQLVSTASATPAMDQSFALDVQSMEALRRTARSAPEQALKQVSRQFEAIFVGMMLKSMREATPGNGLLDGEQGKMYRSLLDQQLAQHLSGRGLKLADTMLAQLRRTLRADGDQALAAAAAAPGGSDAAPVARSVPVAGPTAAPVPAPVAREAGPSHAQPPLPVASAIRAPQAQGKDLPAPAAAAADRPPPTGSGIRARVEMFVATLGESAQSAAAASGVPSALILAQAALESAWGRREPRGADGAQSFNVFGIKADASWRGRVSEAVTTEVVRGTPRRVVAKFRAYDSYQDAFADYAKFLTRNPRYANVLSHTDPAQAAHALQRAGYATDPDYAGKLVRVMRRLLP
jgi:peptidoglycan hydrolase FlgJ